MVVELVKGVALLLALCFLHGFNIRLWRQHPLTGQVCHDTGLLQALHWPDALQALIRKSQSVSPPV